METMEFLDGTIMERGTLRIIRGPHPVRERYVVALGDVASNRATVTRIRPMSEPAHMPLQYALLDQDDDMPDVGERVWVRHPVAMGLIEITGRE